MKKIVLICSILFLLAISACNSKQFVENNSENTYDLNIAIENAKCVTDYPDTATIDDFDTVKFGKYEQDGDESNGKEDIEWILLKKFDGKVKLISKYVLDNVSYNVADDENSYKWETSNLRRWLNEVFYNNAFNNDEKALIESYCTIKRKKNSIFDRVFCFNKEDLDIVREITQIDTYATEYAKNIINNGEKIKIDYQYSESKGYSPYYTMIPGIMYGNEVEYVAPVDGFCADGLSEDGIGIRPMIVIIYDYAFNETTQETNDEKIKKNELYNTNFLNLELEKISKNNTIKKYIIDDRVDKCPIIRIGKYKTESENDYGDIEWLVLEKDEENGKALLLSKYVLNNISYNEFMEDELTWEGSSLRWYLNNAFYSNVFSENEKQIITLCENINYADRPIGHGPGSEPIEYGNITSDKVFILSINDLYKYFNHEWYDDDKNIMAMPTTFAKDVLNIGNKLILDSSNTYCCYWLRDIGTNDCFASYVTTDGCEYAMTFVDCCKIGVRPAMWVKYK